MEKVLILGGSYFIGKHVVHTLKDNYDVYVLNRGSNPFNDEHINELKADRNELTQMQAVLSNIMFDYVVDISGYTEPHLHHVLESMNSSALKNYVFISTSAVYDISAKRPPFKEDDPLGGDSPFKTYAENKIACEAYLFKTLNKDQITIFRPPFVYGPDNYIYRERLMFMFIEANQEIFIPQSNNQILFVYVKDLALQMKEAIEGIIPPGIYNVGNQYPVTFSQWVSMCEDVVNQKTEITFIDPKDFKVNVTAFFPFFDYDNVLSVDKIKQYSPTETPMFEGLKEAYNDYLTVKNTLKKPKRIDESYGLIQSLRNVK